MFYLGITVMDGGQHEAFICNLPYENGIIYVRKGLNPEDLLIPAHELESFKGKIRRVDIRLYNQLNDDFGVHVRSKN
jgi:hypothetical protein